VRSESDYEQPIDGITSFLIGLGIGVLWEATKKSTPDPIMGPYFAGSVMFVPLLCGFLSYLFLGRMIRLLKWLFTFGRSAG
jgi:hypothetical protein